MVPFNAVFSLPHDGRCLVSARPRVTTLVPANGQGHVLTEAVRLVTTRGLGHRERLKIMPQFARIRNALSGVAPYWRFVVKDFECSPNSHRNIQQRVRGYLVRRHG
jgi:hypothetical protein